MHLSGTFFSKLKLNILYVESFAKTRAAIVQFTVMFINPNLGIMEFIL